MLLFILLKLLKIESLYLLKKLPKFACVSTNSVNNEFFSVSTKNEKWKYIYLTVKHYFSIRIEIISNLYFF